MFKGQTKLYIHNIFLDFVLDLAAVVLVVIVVVSRLEFSLQNGVPGAIILSYQAYT